MSILMLFKRHYSDYNKVILSTFFSLEIQIFQNVIWEKYVKIQTSAF